MRLQASQGWHTVSPKIIHLCPGRDAVGRTASTNWPSCSWVFGGNTAEGPAKIRPAVADTYLPAKVERFDVVHELDVMTAEGRSLSFSKFD
jgi:hypothetical protein